MTRRLALLVCSLAGCVPPTMTRSLVGGITVGVAHPIGDALADDGMELRLAGASGKPGHDDGDGWHVAYRRAGTTQELALGFHTFNVVGLGDHLAMFGRAGINLIEWDRVGTDDGAGLGGPSLELGIGRNARPGPCLVVSAARDLRFNDRDDTFLGVSLGVCEIAPTHAR